MTLPMTLPSNGYLRLAFEGAVAVAGSGVQQSWDLTGLPLAVRSDPAFKTSLLVLVRPSGAGVTAVETDVEFLPATGVPEELVLTLDAASIASQILLDVWFLHSVLGARSTKAQLYFIAPAGGVAAATALYTSSVLLSTVDDGTELAPNTLYFLNADTDDFEVLLPATPAVGAPILLIPLDSNRRVLLTAQGGDSIFGPAVAGTDAWIAAVGESIGDAVFQLTYNNVLAPAWLLEGNDGRTRTYKRQALVVAFEPLVSGFIASGPSGEPTETLTANANGPLDVDGIACVQGIPGLVIAGETGADRQYHGIWDVTQTGDGGNPAILRRRLDFAFDATTGDGAKVPVIQGRYTGLEMTFPYTANPGDQVDWIYPALVDAIRVLDLNTAIGAVAAFSRTLLAGDAVGIFGQVMAREIASGNTTVFRVEGSVNNVAGVLTIAVTVTTVNDTTGGNTAVTFTDAGGGVLQGNVENTAALSTNWSLNVDFLDVD